MRTLPLCLLLAALLPTLSAGAQSSARRWISANGAELNVLVEGHGPAVVLLHGGFMDSTMWDGQVKELAKDFTVVRFDFRGYGSSKKPFAPYLPGSDVIAVLDHLNVESAAIVGLSMGGGVAIDFALQYPHRTTHLVLAEPALAGYQWSSETTSVMQSVMAAMKDGGKEVAIARFLEQPVFATARNKPEALKAIRAQLQRNFSIEPNQMQALRPLAISRLGELTMPTLLLVSEFSGADAKAIAAKIATDVPNLTTRTVAQSGHMMNLENPAAFTQLLRDFLRSDRSAQ